MKGKNDKPIQTKRKKTMKRLLATTIALPFLCATAQADPAQVSRIFTHANLNVPFKKLERLTGKPVKVEPGRRHYQVGQCLIRADNDDGDNKTVTSLTLKVSPDCTFDLSQLVKAPKSTYVHELTFMKFAQVKHVGAMAIPCLDLCNAPYRFVHMSWQGGADEKYLQIDIENDINTPESREAADQWIQDTKQLEGDKYHPNGIAWTDKHYRRGLTFFKDIPITTIQIGYCFLDACNP